MKEIPNKLPVDGNSPRDRYLSFTSIVLGTILLLYQLFHYVFIISFSSIGFRESASATLLYLLLIVGGLVHLKNLDLGLTIFAGFAIGVLFDRLLVLALYTSYVTTDIFIPPFLASIIIISTWFFTRGDHSKKHLRGNKYIVYVILIVAIIILAPKIIGFILYT